jgi:hypothetical protein
MEMVAYGVVLDLLNVQSAVGVGEESIIQQGRTQRSDISQ